MKSVLIAAILLIFASTTSAHSQDAAATLITICDHAAANPTDHNRPAGIAGVPFEKISAAAAVAACEGATKANPKEARSYYQLGRAYEATKSYDRARAQYTTAHDMGYIAAAKNIGLLYNYGRGVEQSYAEARRWFEIAAAGEDQDAINNIGILYYNGQGVERNYAEARRWFEKAAAQGLPSAMYHLGMIYDSGHGVAVDFVEARRWHEQAAAKGNANAMNSIGTFYARGEGVKRDRKEARRWYEKAIAAGETKHAARNLRILSAAASGGYVQSGGGSGPSRDGGGTSLNLYPPGTGVPGVNIGGGWRAAPW